jgi:hypothetical protein
MEQREFVKNLIEEVEKSPVPSSFTNASVFSETVHRRPYTFVRLRITNPSADPVSGYGFSKVCWPDKWNKEVGEHIALAKAARDVARQVYNAS